MASYPMPYPMRSGQYDDSAQFRNPAGTMPFPQPGDMPVGLWYGARVEIPWNLYVPPAVPPIPPFNKATFPLFVTTWSSPVYDLQPEHRSMANNRSDRSNTSNPFMGTPIWGSAGGKLRVQIMQLGPVVEGLKVEAVEQAHVCDVAMMENMYLPQDITAEFTSSENSAILRYYPCGDSTPDRYWRLNLTFYVYQTATTPVPPNLPDPLIIQAAYY
jgi:hypothetical protein